MSEMFPDAFMDGAVVTMITDNGIDPKDEVYIFTKKEW